MGSWSVGARTTNSPSERRPNRCGRSLEPDDGRTNWRAPGDFGPTEAGSTRGRAEPSATRSGIVRFPIGPADEVLGQAGHLVFRGGVVVGVAVALRVADGLQQGGDRVAQVQGDRLAG